MPPRKRQQYRPQRRRTTTTARPDDQRAAQALDGAARELLAQHSLEELQALMAQTRQEQQWADEQAQLDPSGDALRRFRTAERVVAEVERALALAEQEPRDTG
jgi:hypothetical protein